MIAIHARRGSFSDRWIEFCQASDIAFKVVDCFQSDILEQLQGCRALMWHWAHSDFRAQLFARQLIASAKEMGIVVFPDIDTCWHYDDKVGQKYLLEAIGAPLVPSHVFYDKKAALDWVARTDFPKVWKLRGGAGSQNVRLVRSRTEARKIIIRSFGRGWRDDRFHALRERMRCFRSEPTVTSFINIGRGIVRSILPHEVNRASPTQKNYVYFQDFIPDNDCDVRIVVIGDRSYGFRRMVRGEDFRASGSGVFDHDPRNIPGECIRIAFETAGRLRLQSCAFDFVLHEGRCLIIEISYAFALQGYRGCPGYWDTTLHWHENAVTPERFMVEDLVQHLEVAELA